MMRKMIIIIGTTIGAIIGSEYARSLNTGFYTTSQNSFFTQSSTYYLSIAIGAILGCFISMMFAGSIIKGLHAVIKKIEQLPTRQLASSIVGLLLGLVLYALIHPIFSQLSGVWRVVPIIVIMLTGYLGLQIGLRKQDEFSHVFNQWLDKKVVKSSEQVKGFEEHKILDTSVIIDGRIADICKTGFIEGTLVIPEFVLEELQHIADSSDLLKRNRGRRGLDILNKIQKELDVHVLVYEGDYEDIAEVDSKLVKLAKALSGKVVTNDYNLNKVCELQGVSVLNINDLANAVKPVVLPGEEIVVQLIKDGKENGQAVAYLDDGTMIVVEGGREYIGTTLEVLVTSVLQTSAGRMIFAKPKLLEKAQ